MPCYDPRPDDELRDLRKAHENFTHNSYVAELLCGVLRRMSASERLNIFAASPSTARWWAEHQARDAAKAKGKKN